MKLFYDLENILFIRSFDFVYDIQHSGMAPSHKVAIS